MPSDDEEAVDVLLALLLPMLNMLFMECSEMVKSDDFATVFRIKKLVDYQFQNRCRQATTLDVCNKSFQYEVIVLY